MDLPDSGIEPASLIFPLVAGRFLTTSHLGSLRTRLKVSASHVLSNHSVVSKTFATSWTVAHQAPAAATAAKLLQSCPISCDPIDGYPPGSSVPGILQARTLEWVAISFSKAGK